MSELLRLPANHAGRDFVVGDIHGYKDHLDKLLEEVAFDKSKDRLIAVGDLIDRGAFSMEVLRMLDEKPQWFFSVRGNHEQMMCDAVGVKSKYGRHGAGPDSSLEWDMWMTNGGRWAIGYAKSELYDLAEIARALPLCIAVGDGDIPDYAVVHAEFTGTQAELLAGKYWRCCPGYPGALAMQWARTVLTGQNKPAPMLFPIYVGHNTVDGAPGRIDSHVFLDTGVHLVDRYGAARYGLSMINAASGEVYTTVRCGEKLEW